MATTISYSLQPIPVWYFTDLTGKPLSSGYMLTKSSLDPTLAKFAYRDPNGTQAWPERIDFNLNGSQGPFYWKFDSSTPNDLYFLEVYDRNNNLQFTINNFGGEGGSGGGGGTTYQSLKNYIINNTYKYNIGTTSTPLSILEALAPGAHNGFVGGANTGGWTAGNITFSKSNTSSIDDKIEFKQFTLGSNVLTGDVTPQYYLNYTTGASASGETYKYVQYPLVSKVQNLSNQQVSFTIWARCNSGSNQVTLYLRQFYGDGAGASAETRTPIATLNLTSSWKQYSVTTITPDSTGKTLGGCHNDALFLQFQYPLSLATDIDHTKPAMYLGAVVPSKSFDTSDEIDSLINSPQTGDIKTAVNYYFPYGWIRMNDGTIGNPSSNSSERANFDTFPLFSALWYSISNTYAPLLNSAGVPIARGVSAVADFTANNQLTIPLTLGRMLGNAGNGAGLTPRVAGEYLGSETISIAAMPSHDHPGTVMEVDEVGVDLGSAKLVFSSPTPGHANQPVVVQPQGGGSADGNMPPVTFVDYYMKL